ncbi:MAG: hypothetical protein K8R21_00290 [Leptospira sp.]|nr:hypothetical protein [Leptospira sp.]
MKEFQLLNSTFYPIQKRKSPLLKFFLFFFILRNADAFLELFRKGNDWGTRIGSFFKVFDLNSDFGIERLLLPPLLAASWVFIYPFLKRRILTYYFRKMTEISNERRIQSGKELISLEEVATREIENQLKIKTLTEELEKINSYYKKIKDKEKSEKSLVRKKRIRKIQPIEMKNETPVEEPAVTIFEDENQELEIVAEENRAGELNPA